MVNPKKIERDLENAEKSVLLEGSETSREKISIPIRVTTVIKTCLERNSRED